MLLLLLGLFSQGCREGQIRSEEFFADGRAVYLERAHYEVGCGTLGLEIRSYGRVNEGALVPVPVGARELDFIFSDVTVKLAHENAVLDFNARRVCGRDDWALGTEVSVAGLRCELGGAGIGWRVPSAGSVRYGVYALSESGAEVFFGRLTPEFDASTPARRPRTWDRVPFRKQL